MASGYLYTSNNSGATWTSNISLGQHGWQTINSSSDGTKLVAAGNGTYIYTSTDGGITWIPRTSVPQYNWQHVAISSDGMKIVGVTYYNYIYISTDGGLTWNSRATSFGGLPWRSVFMSSDGSNIVAVAGSSADYIYTSNDGGLTWTKRTTSLGSKNWQSVSGTPDGSKLVATVSGGYVYTSSDSGATWATSTTAGSRNWRVAAISSDGTKIIAAVNGGYIYRSINSGTTWATSTAAGSRNWYDLASSQDGSKIVAVAYNGYSYTSTDGGVTWVEHNGSNSGPITRLFTTSVATVRNFLTEGGRNDWVIIAQGVVVDLTNAIYDVATDIFKALAGGSFISNPSINGGAHVVPSINIATTTLSYTGDPSTKTLKWLPSIDWDTATNCIYSYNSDYSNPVTTICSHNDTSLPRPTFGSHTLYVRGTDANGGITEKSLTFFYDNTSPVWTSCGSDLLDEVSRPYYYLIGDTSNNCTATVNTELHGASTTQSSFILSGNVDGTGHTITLKYINVTGTISSVGSGSGASGGTVNVYNSVVATTTVSGTTGTNGGNGGTIYIASSTTGLLTALGANGTSHGGNGGTITIGTSTTARIL
ncbi:MAG: hypothetical protein WCO18_02310, partial [bacterium]